MLAQLVLAIERVGSGELAAGKGAWKLAGRVLPSMAVAIFGAAKILSTSGVRTKEAAGRGGRSSLRNGLDGFTLANIQTDVHIIDVDWNAIAGSRWEESSMSRYGSSVTRIESIVT